ncbi:hypothetical protein FOA43_004432 [Brettanomyces nanus]|uniref:C2H2-type domain-containing protein n=1 Tax=Eeniella nana TaxID=13502 RepID=A0A875SAD4_EENNA|nr:uncharacterized protein FOA43_004432 [Brettanomyces nanus]QPG77035.1 hypothetical protein FOA43_004432 [Brettanomyces nanus]
MSQHLSRSSDSFLSGSASSSSASLASRMISNSSTTSSSTTPSYVVSSTGPGAGVVGTSAPPGNSTAGHAVILPPLGSSPGHTGSRDNSITASASGAPGASFASPGPNNSSPGLRTPTMSLYAPRPSSVSSMASMASIASMVGQPNMLVNGQTGGQTNQSMMQTPTPAGALPPLFKLVLDSTLPMMNYPTPQTNGMSSMTSLPLAGQPTPSDLRASSTSPMPSRANSAIGMRSQNLPVSSSTAAQYHYPMAMPSAMYFPQVQQLPTPPQLHLDQRRTPVSQYRVNHMVSTNSYNGIPVGYQTGMPGAASVGLQGSHLSVAGNASSPVASPVSEGKRRRAISGSTGSIGTIGTIGTNGSNGPNGTNGANGTSGPRKKRECPICHNFYSNLTTHKSIHNKGSKPYACTTCSRAFKRLNDLIRHEKCHLSKLGAWEYQCPFHPGASSGNSHGEISCHQTGYFTRCDTYKNHLKAIHFKYPPNTLKSERSKVSGHCKECGMYFNGVQDWLKNHIENNVCPKIINFNNNHKKR